MRTNYQFVCPECSEQAQLYVLREGVIQTALIHQIGLDSKGHPVVLEDSHCDYDFDQCVEYALCGSCDHLFEWNEIRNMIRRGRLKLIQDQLTSAADTDDELPCLTSSPVPDEPAGMSELISSICERYGVPERELQPLIETAVGEGMYAALVHLATQILMPFRNDQLALEYVLDLRDLPDPTPDLRAYNFVMNEIDKMRTELGIPFEEFLQQLSGQS